MKKITGFLKNFIKRFSIELKHYFSLNEGKYKLYFLFELKEFSNSIKNETNISILSFKVKAKRIIEEAFPSNTEEMKFNTYKFTRSQDEFLEIIDNQPEFVKLYLSKTDASELNVDDFLTIYESIKEGKVYTKKQKEKDRVFEKARQLYDTPGKKQQAVRLLSYYDETRDLKLSGNYKERLCELTKVINRNITGFTTIFAEPYRKSDKTLATIEKRLEEIKNIFIELNIYEANRFIDRDIQNRLH